MENCFKYFKNDKCEYYPCHSITNDYFNCMFCYCPLYALGDKCGGNFVYLDNGIKDCSNCLIPHCEKGYSHIMTKLGGITELASKQPED